MALKETVTVEREVPTRIADLVYFAKSLAGRDPGTMTDEELIEGLSFSAYHRISTAIFVPALSGSAIELVTIDPLDLEAALERDAATPAPANDVPSVTAA